MSTNPIVIDVDAINAEIQGLPIEELQRQLLEVRTKQKVQQKKYQNTETQKAYRQKRAAAIAAMTEQAKKTPATKPGFANLYEQIRAEAAERAEQLLADDAVASEAGDE
jgi:predicted RNA-binding Zn ribbon-like protein